MRKALLFLSAPFIVLVLGFLLISTDTHTTQPTVHTTPDALSGVVPTTPMVTPTYDIPLCENEDGSGQMLCMWDADYQGDGEGTDVIAGDCSTDTVGSKADSELCIKAWQTIDGAKRVDECLTIEWEISTNTIARETGWTLGECFKAMTQ